MKKAIFLGIAVLMALAMVSCDDVGSAPNVPSNVVGYTADGRAIVELEMGIGLGSARALHGTLAAAAADFYEVIFYDDASGDILRASWREGKTARLRVPLANYTSGNTDDNYAYIFAGRYEDGMLLGVGGISATDGTGPKALAEVVADTTYANFQVYALTTNVTNVEATSTFQPANWDVSTIKISDKEIPVFMFEADDTSTAEFDITTALPAGAPFLAHIKYSGGAGNDTVHRPYAWPDSVDDNPIDLASVVYTDTITAGDPVTLPIGLSITTEPDDANGKGGLALLGIEIPVILETNDPAKNGAAAKVWYLKGGLNNSLIDMGYGLMGMGGSVVIGSGNVLEGSGIKLGKL